MQDPSEKKKKRTIEDYYNSEYRYLDEAGKEFARAYPQRARFLNIGQRDDRDPYVERLFEGFSFLTGRIRQRLDDELPELTQSLMGLMWPHFLRPIPSLSILQLGMPGMSTKHKPQVYGLNLVILAGLNVDLKRIFSRKQLSISKLVIAIIKKLSWL